MSFGRRTAAAATAAAFAACAFLLAGCSKVVKSEGAEKSVADLVSRKTGFRPTDVKCPSDVDAKVGGTFECHFSGPRGERYTAFMRILEVKGTRVLFRIRTSPDR